MNTRLQVEHPVTEEVFGVDLVQLQLESAGVVAASPLVEVRAPSDLETKAHAIEVRLYAEDPAADYAPQVGTLDRFEFPDVAGLRVEAGFTSGSIVSPFYDAMLAKLIVAAPTRDDAARRLVSVLRRARLHGLKTNRDQLIAVLTDERFLSGDVSTSMLADGSIVPERAVGDAGPARSAAALAWVESQKAAARVQQRVATGYRNVVSQPHRVEFTDDTVAEWWGERTGYRVDGATVVAASPTEVVLDVDGVRRRYEVAISGNRIDVDGPDGHVALERKPRFVDPVNPGRSRLAARADARQRGRGPRPGRRRGRRGPAHPGDGGHEDAAHHLRAVRRHGHRARRHHRPAGRGGRCARCCHPRRHRQHRNRRNRLMTINFTEPEERVALREAVKKLASKYGREFVEKQAREGGKMTEMWLEMGQNGFLGVNIPEEHGGGGGGMADLAAVLEEASAAGAPLLMMVVSPAICGSIISRCGTEEQKAASGCPASPTAPC